MANSAQHRRWILLLGGVVVGGLLGIAAVVILIDPFFQYHKPLPYFSYAIENQYCQNPGMAKTMDYDNVILGSSMTTLFETKWFDEGFGGKTLRLTMNASGGLEQDKLLTIMENRKDLQLSYVFLGMDLAPYRREIGTPAYPLEETYYDENPFNDISYWWNQDVLKDYIVKPLLKGKRQGDVMEANTVEYQESWYNKDQARVTYTPVDKVYERTDTDAYAEPVTENLRNYIIPHIEQNKDAKFYIFFPPYSVLYWHDALQKNDFDAQLEEYKVMVKLLAEYPNVAMFFFPVEEIITNLDYYKDYTHYNKEVCMQMYQWMLQNEKRITIENVDEMIGGLKELIENYDYSIWGLDSYGE